MRKKTYDYVLTCEYNGSSGVMRFSSIGKIWDVKTHVQALEVAIQRARMEYDVPDDRKIWIMFWSLARTEL